MAGLNKYSLSDNPLTKRKYAGLNKPAVSNDIKEPNIVNKIKTRVSKLVAKNRNFKPVTASAGIRG